MKNNTSLHEQYGPKSLHEQYGPKAIKVLQGAMKNNASLDKEYGPEGAMKNVIAFPDCFDVQDNGNHYVLTMRETGISMEVPLFSARVVAKALTVFLTPSMG